MAITVENKGFKKIDKLVGRTPKLIRRARRSATSACANFSRHTLKDFLEFGFIKPDLHPLTKFVRYSRYTGKWRKRSKALKSTPFYVLRRFTGFFVNKDGSLANIGIGTKNKGGALFLDKSYKDLIRKHSIPRKTPLNARNRAIINKGLLKIGRPPLKKTTKFLTIPARNFMPVIFKIVNATVPKLYDKRFGDAMSRYITGKPPKSSRIGL